MRKLIAALHISLDGCISGEKGELDWAAMSEEIDKDSLPELIHSSDACLLGRVLYEGFYSYWPHAKEKNPSINKSELEFAEWIDRVPKYVITRTLNNAEWNNSVLLKGDVKEEVLRLKDQPGKNILVFGGVRTAQTLAALNLIDEYRLLLNPVVINSGRQLFKDASGRANLKLTHCRAFEAGAVALHYQYTGS